MAVLTGTWRGRLDRSGRVVIETGRMGLGCVTMIALGFTLAGLLMIRGSSMWSWEWMIGILSVGFFGVLGLPLFASQFVNPDRLIVSQSGVELKRGWPNSRTNLGQLAWSGITDIETVEVPAGSGTSSHTVLRLTPEAYAHIESRDSDLMAALRKTERDLIDGPGMALPTTLKGGAEPITAFLRETWQRFR